MEQKKMGMKLSIMILGLLIILAVATTAFYLQTTGKESKITKNIELADQHLENLEQAGTVFADAEKYEEASELNTDDSLKDKQEELQKLPEEQNQKKEEEARNNPYEELLKPVLEAWQSNDMETIRTLIQQDTYNDMAATLKDGESYYYGEYDESGERSGIGCGVYIVEDYYNGKIPMYYLGEWRDGLREGHANWLYSMNPEDRHYDCFFEYNFECNWSNDVPEGNITGSSELLELDPMDGAEVLTGTVIHGLYHETAKTIYWSDGAEGTYTYTYTNGYINILRTESPDDYIVGISDKNIEMWYDEEEINLRYGLPGFGEAW